MDKHYVYLIENEVNHKLYVGMTSKTPEYRFRQHKSEAPKSDIHLHRAMMKHGTEKFTVIPYKEFENRQKALEGERQAIKFFNTFRGRGYNQALGGRDGGQGENHVASKIRDREVRKIRKRLANGESVGQIADEFNVCKALIRDYRAGRSRKAAGGPIMGEDYEDPDKIKKQEVREIRRKHKNGATRKELAKEYDVYYRTVADYVNGRTKKEAGGPIKGEDYDSFPTQKS